MLHLMDTSCTIGSLDSSADGHLVSGSGRQTTRIWDIELTVILKVLGVDDPKTVEGVRSVTFSPEWTVRCCCI